MEVNKDSNLKRDDHPKCEKCGCIFTYLTYHGDDVVLNKKEMELAIFARCRCGYVTVFLPNEVPECLKDDLNEA